MARALGAELHLVHVREIAAVPVFPAATHRLPGNRHAGDGDGRRLARSGRPSYLPADLPNDKEKARSRSSRNELTRTERATIAHEREGSVVEEILKTAQEISADLIVMGSHGHGPVYNLLVGSVTEGVLKAGLAPGPASCPRRPLGNKRLRLARRRLCPKRLPSMRTFKSRFAFLFFLGAAVGLTNAATLPFQTVFKGREKFDYLVQQAQANNWKSLPIGDRTAAVGRALVGTRYKSFTLEIDDHVEAPSANFYGMDCWTFFEIALGFARMLDEPQAEWTPATLLHYVELDRYRGGHCTGEYLSRLHYLEDWLADNDRRGLVEDLTRELGGVRANHAAQEMTFGWRHYRYLKANPSLARSVRPNGSQSQRAATLPDSRRAGSPESSRS